MSYLPQHYRIINRRSSFGLSPYFVLLGATSGTCAFANILTLPTSRKDIACCHEIDGFPCFAGLLGVLQVGVQWSCFTIMYTTPMLPIGAMLILSQSTPLPRLLPSSHSNDTRRFERPQSPHPPNRAGRDRTEHPACHHHRHPLLLLHLRSTTESTRMGQLPGDLRNSSRIHTILSTNIHNLHAKESGQLEHSHDVDTNTRKLCLGRQSRCKSWQGGVEYLGSLSSDWMPPRNPAGHGHHLRTQRTTKRTGWGDTD